MSVPQVLHDTVVLFRRHGTGTESSDDNEVTVVPNGTVSILSIRLLLLKPGATRIAGLSKKKEQTQYLRIFVC